MARSGKKGKSLRVTANFVNAISWSLVFSGPIPDLNSGSVRTVLRADTLGIVLGILLLALGLAGIVLFRVYRRRDSALFWFSLFAGLYGLRLLASTRVLPFLAAPVPRAFWLYLVAGLSYTIAIPVTLFLYAIYPHARRVLGWLVGLQIGFAAIALVADQFLRVPDSLHGAQNVLMLGGLVLLGVIILRQRNGSLNNAMFAAGLLIFLLTVLLTNVPVLARFRFSAQLEPIGLVVFLSVWGFGVAQRIVRDEERLIGIRKELEIAREIQMSILPRQLPETEHFKIETRYLPMTEVAGDFYDFLVIDQNRIGIFIADVAGHGVPAALIASMLKIAITAQAAHASDPARVMTALNQTLCGRLQQHLITAAYLYIDLDTRKMAYAAAGHPPLLWFQKLGQKTCALEENGLLLGVVANAQYSSVEKDIRPGDRLLMYTDGLLEASNPADESFGENGVEQVLLSAKSVDANQFATRLLEALANWTGFGSNQTDDITIIVIDLCAKASTPTPSSRA